MASAEAPSTANTAAPTTIAPTAGLSSALLVAEKLRSLVTGNLLPLNSRATEAAAIAARASLDVTAKSLVATVSFETAVAACKEKVEKIAKECRRFNRKYRDAHFGEFSPN